MVFPSAVVMDVMPVIVRLKVPLAGEGVVAYAGKIDASASIRPALAKQNADHFGLVRCFPSTSVLSSGR